MWKKIFNVLKYLLFLGIGIFLLWLLYRNESLAKYESAFKHLNYFWIFASLVFSVLSQISRAIRWNMLIKPLGYSPKLYNTYLSVLILYFVNLLIPRAGEVFRCTVLSKYEKIPFAKLAGTVFVERMADFIALMVLAIIIFATQVGVFIQFFDTHEDIRQNFNKIFSLQHIALGVGILILLIAAFLVFRSYYNRNKSDKGKSLARKIHLIKQNFVEGIKSIAQLENKWLFVGHTLFIFTMWLFMLYVIFLAYKPTSHLSLETGMITFLMGGLAMLAPVQAGLGAWHFMVIETLVIYGIDKEHGKIFAIIAHTYTNLIYLVLGLIALIVMPLINSRVRKSVNAS